MHPNEHSIKRGANFFKVIELLTQLKRLESEVYSFERLCPPSMFSCLLSLVSSIKYLVSSILPTPYKKSYFQPLMANSN